MEITWLGHSSVCINSRDVLLITDPYDTSGGEFKSPHKADLITISNEDPKHSNASAITGNPRVIKGPGEYEISHFYVKGIGTPLSDSDTDNGAINTIYTIRVEGLIVSHLGKLNRKLNASQMDSLRQTQVLIAPVAGEGVLQSTTLQEIISTVQPRILLLVQHGNDTNEGLNDPQKFLSDIGITDVPDPAIRLNITETNLPTEMQVQLLRKQN